MLDTVLQIGKAFRSSPTGLRHHRYIEPCPNDTDRLKVLRLSIPVRKDFSFDFDSIGEISDENIIRDKLFYLKFKTSDKDSSIKYMFGDFWYLRNTKNKEIGSYRTVTYSGYNAFDRAEDLASELNSSLINNFRRSFYSNIEKVEQFLVGSSAIFIHFDFFGEKHWYEFEEDLDELNSLMIKKFTSSIEREKSEGFVFDSMLYRTLCSGDPKNDIQFPNFNKKEKYKSRLFSHDQVADLFYAIDFSEKPAIKAFDLRIGGAKEKIEIVVLPLGSKLTASDYENFSLSREKIVEVANRDENVDLLFAPMTEEVASAIASFDVVFCKKGQKVISDVIEISALERSLITKIKERIIRIKADLHEQYDYSLSIVKSFLNILGDTTKEKKKYQSHLYKVLPQIYSETYYQDPILLPRCIEKTEENIRASKANFNFLKYDFYFLTLIQNTAKEGENLMDIQHSRSYRIGQLLGELAQQFAAWRDDCPIKSFEKSYVGTLSRRITTLSELLRFKTFIEEKLVLHERSKFTFKVSRELAEAIKEIESSSEEKYDRHKCAFGFFESYFGPSDNIKETDKAKLNVD